VESVSAVLVDLGGWPGSASATTSTVAQTQPPAPPPGTGEEFGKASPIGLVVIILLGIATVFLVRSMSKRIRRLPASFDRPEDEPAEGPDGAPAGRDVEDAGGTRT
jgi:hypothetical protein